MNPTRLSAAALLALALALPAHAQKDKRDGKKPDPVEAENALKPGQFGGKLVASSPTSLTLRLEYSHLELNLPKNWQQKAALAGLKQQDKIFDIIRQQQAIANDRERLRRAKNPRQQADALRALQHHTNNLQQLQVQAQMQALGGAINQKNLYKEVKETKDINIDLDDSLAVRTNFLPVLYDDMGSLKKFSDKEKKELRGDGKLPGYKAAAGDLKAGQKVLVVLAKNKETDNQLRGTMVLVVEESNEPSKPDRKPKK